MKKKWFSVIVLQVITGVLLAAFVGGQTPQQHLPWHSERQAPALKLNTAIVNLTVTVTDRRNKAVPGLELLHFEVYEDNVRQQVEYFRCEDEPLSIGIIFDLSGSMEKKVQHAQAAVRSFMQASHQDDEFFLLGFNQQCNLMADFTDADSLMERLMTGKAQGRTALYDAVYLGIEKLRSGRHSKRALLVVSDGADNASRFTSNELYQQLREENILVYCLGYKMWVGEDYDCGRAILEDLAKITGGGAFFPDSAAELEDAVSTIALELRRQYSLAYSARETGHYEQWRKIKIRVTPPNGVLKLRVRTRAGYYAGIGDRSLINAAAK